MDEKIVFVSADEEILIVSCLFLQIAVIYCKIIASDVGLSNNEITLGTLENGLCALPGKR